MVSSRGNSILPIHTTMSKTKSKPIWKTIRRTWRIHPGTQIVPNKKREQSRKFCRKKTKGGIDHDKTRREKENKGLSLL